MGTPNTKYRVLAAGAVVQLCIGIIYIWSVFRAPVAAYYAPLAGEDLAVTCVSLTYSLMLAFYVLGIVLGGRLADRKGARPVVLLGGILFGAGILLSAASAAAAPDAPWLICVFYGGVAGFGVGAAYTSTISCAQKWFPERRGFATGVIVSTFGASTVVFTPLVNAFLEGLGVPGTFLTLGILFLAITLVCARFVYNPTGETAPAAAAASRTEKKQYTPSEMLRTRTFWLLFASMFLILPAYFILNPIFLTLGEQRGLDETAALASVMITGIASACGRLAAPWLSDRMARKNVILLLFAIMLGSSLLLIGAAGAAYMVLIACVSFAFGGSAGVYPAVTSDYFGTRNSGMNYGLVMVAFAASALIFPTVATAVNEGGSATPLTFVIPAVTCVIGIIATIIMRPPSAVQENQRR